MNLGKEVGLGPRHTVLDGEPAPLTKSGTAPQFSAHVCCGQTAGWMKMPFGMEVGLCPRDIVLHGDPASPKKGRSTRPHFSAMNVYRGQTVAHLSYTAEHLYQFYVTILCFNVFTLPTLLFNKSSAVGEIGDRLATTDMGRKLGCVPLLGELGPM